MRIEFVTKNPNTSLQLAKDYISNVLLKDQYFARNYIQILKHLKALSVFGNTLCCADGSTLKLPLEVTLPNRMGINQNAKIVKQLNRFLYSYEIRMDDVYSHCRVIFFVHQIDENTSTFTFGFTKCGVGTDKTDLAASETDKICALVISGEKHLWT